MATHPDPVTELRQSARQVIRELGLLRDHWPRGGVGLSGCHALLELEHADHRTIAELAERLVLDRSTTSRIVQRLVRRGLVRVEPSPEDRRRKPIGLTAAGRAQLRRLHAAARAPVAAALTQLSATDQTTVVRGLTLYAQALTRARRRRGIVLRPIRPGDNPAIARLIRAVLAEFGATGPGTSLHDPEIGAMAQAYRGKGSAYFVLARGRTVLGGGGLAPLAGAEAGICELRKMYFRPEIRGLGLGRDLLGHCLDQARRLGYHTCYLETQDAMGRAQQLYHAAGFRRLGRRLGHTGHFACHRYYSLSL